MRDGKLDAAARAAWLYYIHGQTQDEIARRMGLSRQSVQRLVGLAVQERLIRFSLDHPIAACLELGERLRGRFGLELAEVVPDGPDGAAGVAVAAARLMEVPLTGKGPVVLGVGTGRTMRRAVAEIAPMQRPEHKIVAVVSNAARDGRVSRFEVAMRLAERVGADCYPLLAPVVADSVADRERLQAQAAHRSIAGLLKNAAAVWVGVGEMGEEAPLLADDFIERRELEALLGAGAVGEIVGWPFDAGGRLLDTDFTRRLPGFGPLQLKGLPVIGVAAGNKKVRPLRAALDGRLITGVVTDEATARAVLDDLAP